MGSFFRSEDMALTQLFIQPEAAYQSISELGEMGVVQFRDLNENVNVFQRKFVNEVRRCDEMDRRLRYIETEIRKDNGGEALPDAGTPGGELPRAPNPREVIDLEAHLDKTENSIRELTESLISLKQNHLEVSELRQVLEKTQQFFVEHDYDGGASDSPQRALISEEAAAGGGSAANANAPQHSIRGRLGFVAGVINRERIAGFERMLWRISRGNVFLRRADIEKPVEDPATGNEYYKTVFVAFFQGEQLKSRIKKVCAGYHASIHACPSSPAERQDMLREVRVRMEDLVLVLSQTEDHRRRVLASVAKDLPNWSIMVRKMKAIYHTLNLFNMDVTKKCLIGECWVPVADIPAVQKALVDGSAAVGSTIPSFFNVLATNEKPPSFNRTNRFTHGFQVLIDSYGISSYREVNPALYTIITFPFLFAMMFGDLGHGLILFIFALFMVINEKKLGARRIGNEIGRIFFGGRYIILLMGAFSIYTGFVYNDVFSKSMNIFGSGWELNRTEEWLQTQNEVMLDPKFEFDSDAVYIIGVDPVWQLAKNKIIFLNSYKMKLSIIFGIVHMVFGVCLSVVNYMKFNRKIDVLLMFVPQIIFLVFLFAWMVVMMFMKWVKYSTLNAAPYSESCAPSVLILFINMMLMKNTPPPENCAEYMFDAQPTVQKILLYVSLLCIPVMLFGHPIHHALTKNKHKKHGATNGDINQGMELQPEATAIDQVDGAAGKGEGGAAQGEHEDESMGEIMIHAGIHTIEYVLSTISHTASYLRLWALSLAHAQLSEVLWSMVLQIGLKKADFTGSIFLFVIFAFWSVLTISILVMMEGLSAFLHTLRLHWVEFMSKFYEGLGHPFQPFSFKQILDEEAGED